MQNCRVLSWRLPFLMTFYDASGRGGTGLGVGPRGFLPGLCVGGTRRSGFGSLLLFDTLPVSIVGTLRLSDEVVEVRRWTRCCPEVLDSVWKTVVVELVEDAVGPTELVSRFLEQNRIAIHTASLRPKILSDALPMRSGSPNTVLSS